MFVHKTADGFRETRQLLVRWSARVAEPSLVLPAPAGASRALSRNDVPGPSRGEPLAADSRLARLRDEEAAVVDLGAVEADVPHMIANVLALQRDGLTAVVAEDRAGRRVARDADAGAGRGPAQPSGPVEAFPDVVVGEAVAVAEVAVADQLALLLGAC